MSLSEKPILKDQYFSITKLFSVDPRLPISKPILVFEYPDIGKPNPNVIPVSLNTKLLTIIPLNSFLYPNLKTTLSNSPLRKNN